SRESKGVEQLPGVRWYALNIEEEHPVFPTISEPLHGLIYAPGSINLKPFRMLKPEDFERDWNVNVLGAVRTFQQYYPSMQAAGRASALLFSTVAVQTGMPFHASIAAAKGALEGLMRSLAAEWAPNIRVNCIAPSLTDTPLASRLLSSEDKIRSAQERHPLKMIGKPEHFVPLAMHLLHPDNWITGQVIHIDGGMSSIRI
ncbi:MAG: SDR family oxidoreductase, partial [Flavobacteriales bacterium]|nr:SDR family oxidoreductase [Flavobacteriales bacterium]